MPNPSLQPTAPSAGFASLRPPRSQRLSLVDALGCKAPTERGGLCAIERDEQKAMKFDRLLRRCDLSEFCGSASMGHVSSPTSAKACSDRFRELGKPPEMWYFFPSILRRSRVRVMKTIRMLLLTILVASLVTACRSTAAQPGMPDVEVRIEAPQPTPTLPACTALPPGTSLTIEPVSASAVRLSGEGFEPGEKLIVVLTSEYRQRRRETRFFPAEPVAADGRFTITVGHLCPVPGAATNTWQVILIHARGAACQTVTLPAPK